VVSITPEYERTHVIGTTFSNAFDDWVLRGEIGYFTEHYYPLLNQGVIKSPELHYVLGLNWIVPWDVLLSGQLIHSCVIHDAEKQYEIRVKSNFINEINTCFILFRFDNELGGMFMPRSCQPLKK
jgi:hypothetical protein